jgi:hypothetical protein
MLCKRKKFGQITKKYVSSYSYSKDVTLNTNAGVEAISWWKALGTITIFFPCFV